MSTDFDFDDVKDSEGVLTEIEDLVENSPELTHDQKGPLRWAIRKAREKADASPRKTSRFYGVDDMNESPDEVAIHGSASDPFDEDIPF